MADVLPFPDDRSDLRMAVNTIAIREVMMAETPPTEDTVNLFKHLTQYLEANKTPEQIHGPAMMRQALGG